MYNWGYNPLTKWDEPPSSNYQQPSGKLGTHLTYFPTKKHWWPQFVWSETSSHARNRSAMTISIIKTDHIQLKKYNPTLSNIKHYQYQFGDPIFHIKHYQYQFGDPIFHIKHYQPWHVFVLHRSQVRLFFGAAVCIYPLQHHAWLQSIYPP